MPEHRGSGEARSCGTELRHRAAALTRAQLAGPGRDVKLHWARSHIGAVRGTVTLRLSCWGRSDLGQHFQVLQDNLQREGRHRVSMHRGRGSWRGQLSFPNPRLERARWEADAKSQHIKKGVGKRGLPMKFKVEISNDCREDGAGKRKGGKTPQLLLCESQGSM